MKLIRSVRDRSIDEARAGAIPVGQVIVRMQKAIEIDRQRLREDSNRLIREVLNMAHEVDARTLDQRVDHLLRLCEKMVFTQGKLVDNFKDLKARVEKMEGEIENREKE